MQCRSVDRPPWELACRAARAPLSKQTPHPAQIRSGDIFAGYWDATKGWDGRTEDATQNSTWRVEKAPHPGYAQPNLTFYSDCLEQQMRTGERAVAVCQDRVNPVCMALEGMARVRRLGLTVLTAAPLGDALAHLGCARTVCGAHSTMSFAYLNGFHTKKFVKPPDYHGSPLNPWYNSGAQREMMLGATPADVGYG